MTIKGKINMAAFKHVIMEKKGKSGMVKGLFIPIEANSLFTSKDGKKFYFDMIAFERKNGADEYGNTHIIKQSFSKEARDAMSEEEQKKQPIFGNIQASVYTPEDASNNVAEGQVFNDGNDDDLPF